MNYFFTSLIILLLCYVPVTAQFSDDFSDGDMQGWEGDTDHFIVNNGLRLQLMAPQGSTTSWLHTDSGFADSMTWDLYIRLDFAPSTSNQLRIYLGLTSVDLASASGYFLEIGASGDADALEFKYLNAGTPITIAGSEPGLVASDPVEMNLHIAKNANGGWEFYEYTGIIPVLLFTTTHDELPLSTLGTFGFYTKYSDTRRDKFSFDNILIQPLLADNQAPRWLSVEVTDAQHLNLLFDEALDPALSDDPSLFVLTPGNLIPSSVDISGNLVTLTFNTPFTNLQQYTLTVTGVTDLSGNAMGSESKHFIFTQIDQANAFEMLITEIMADPSPQVSLPNVEYLEIWNASEKIFNLSDYSIMVGTSERMLPDSLILPGEYVVLVDDEQSALFAGFGKIIAVENMSTLSNSGATITIQNLGGNIIHEVSYTDAWYRDASKSNGGWSIEMKNPFHICSGEANWAAAENLSGGTPGVQNTQWVLLPDEQGPQLISLFVVSPRIIEFRFDEKLEALLVTDPALYSFFPSVTIDHVEVFSPSTVRVHLTTDLTDGISYTISGVESYDCLGNKSIIDTSLLFGISSVALPGDVIINEVLFNPASGGSRFIEILNRSNKFIDLSTLSIGRITKDDQDIFISGIQEILAPGALVVLTPDPQDILLRYTVPFPTRLFEASMPSWDVKSDNVSLLAGGIVIDSFSYSSSWHHHVIRDQNGVSLERISPDSPTISAFNWHSASSVSGYATPTGVNSQFALVGTGEMPFTITNRHFSPNDDGFNDFLLLSFEPESGNDVGSVWVYDLEGREIYQVLTNEILGTSAVIRWDGRNAEGIVADMGIYVIYVQLWNPDGQVRQYQETCALVKRP